jgi:hypothetical protein
MATQAPVGRNQLIIFVKAPRPGHVKTRLAEAIGAGAACSAYREMVEALLRNLRGLDDIQLRFTPDDALAEISHWVHPPWTAAPQVSGDLTQKLIAAFHEAFASGAERVAIIGSDSPDISRTDIQSAWAALTDHDVVLGPTEDGGYWLIGLRAERPALFQNIPWSSNSVLQETLARAETAALKTSLLRVLPDIDTVEDLRRFQGR